MDRDQLAARLWNAAQRRAAKAGVQFGQGADSDIRSYADRGADRILSAYPGAGPNDPVVRDAEIAFERLVDEMVAAASNLPGYRAQNPNIIGEQTLAAALSRLCPVFPIC